MTKNISSPSANSITSEPEPEPTGQPVTDPSSESTYTSWTLLMEGHKKETVKVRVNGGRGRISFAGRGRSDTGGEVRIYRNETTKVFDAAFSGVRHIYSDRVSVENFTIGGNEKKSVEDVEDTVSMPRTSIFTMKWADLDPFQQDEHIRNHGGDIGRAMEAYESKREPNF